MSTLFDRLPTWSKTINPKEQPNFSILKEVALDFLRMPPDMRRKEVEAYSSRVCFPRMDLPRASGLYVFFRVVFELPASHPRSQTKVFGGWIHPSVGDLIADFDLSWPVRIDAEKDSYSLNIQPFQGYKGKGYDAIGEYDYFVAHFPLRQKETLERLRIGTEMPGKEAHVQSPLQVEDLLKTA
jgi:hypothetical protein